MRALILALGLIFSTTVKAQECPAVGWTNQGVLRALLEKNGEQLIDVTDLYINAISEKVCYRLQGIRKWSHTHYKTCGFEITFTESHSGCIR